MSARKGYNTKQQKEILKYIATQENNYVTVNQIFINRKIFVYMLIALLVAESMFFQFYIAANEVHHCSENHCPVCLVLHEANTVLNQLASGILPVAALFCVIYLTGNIIAVNESFVEPRTLIKWKVRMDH